MMGAMAVRDDCRHYLKRSTPTGEAVERCRINANLENPFACPEGCLFFEKRNLSSAGWTQGPSEPLSNTGQGLLGLPDPPPKRSRRGKKKDR
jgi:hypothetical protein